jgi:hypothetical protein
VESGHQRDSLHRMSVTAILGSEHDPAATNALLQVLRELGANEVSRDWGMVGSQEVNTLRFNFDGRPLIVEAETYVGLSVTGDGEAVEAIVARMREIVGGE